MVLVCQGVLLLWLIGISGLMQFYIFAAIFGFSYGVWVPTFPALLSEFYGRHNSGSILGFSMLGPSVGGAVGAVLTGYIFDSTGSYVIAFLVGAIVTFVAAGMARFLKKPEMSEITVGE